MVALFIADIIAFALASGTAQWTRLGRFGVQADLQTMGALAVNALFLYIFSGYERLDQTPRRSRTVEVLLAVGTASVFVILLTYLSGTVVFSGVTGRGVLLGAQCFFALWVLASRWIVGMGTAARRLRERTLVIGTASQLQALLHDLKRDPPGIRFSFLEIQDTASRHLPKAVAESTSEYPNEIINEWVPLEAGGPALIAAIDQRTKDCHEIVVASPSELPQEVIDRLMHLRITGVHVSDLVEFYEDTWAKIPVFQLNSAWFALAPGFDLLHNPIGLRLKRTVDIAAASLLLLLTWPLFILTWIAVKIDSRGPALFSQVRVGRAGALFTIYKFRSMVIDAEKSGAQWASQTDQRVTRVGRIIRKIRFDELPQLINILKGEMSLIGPRPERPEFTEPLEKQIPFYALRTVLPPGLTGWAQIRYPYGSSVEDAKEKLQFELFYIKNYSPLIDIVIALKTLRVVLLGKGL